MTTTIQMNLFGDILNLDTETFRKEFQNVNSLGSNGRITLEGTPPKLLPKTSDGRDLRNSSPVSRGQRTEHDSRPNGGWITSERGFRDRSPAIHSTDTGEKYSDRELENEIYKLPILNTNISIDQTDLQSVFDQYARYGTGFHSDRDKSIGMQTILRAVAGEKLWENMSYEERKHELSEYIHKDFLIALDESESNPVNYLLDRSLDPLDPMSSVYTVVLKKLGATIDDGKIKLPEHLQKQLGIKHSVNLPRSPGTLRNDHTDDRDNYHITPTDPIGIGGKVVKFEANIEAIRILKSLDEQKRHATPEEQSKLVLYTGWGGLSEVFKRDLEGPWLHRQNTLKEILSDREYRSASHSTMNAHYTSPDVIRGVWTAVERMGYSGGPTLEPASGTGLFFGLRPQHLPIEMHGIELDYISGKIAQQLYQSANIKITGYEDIKMPENRYNLIISNVPFGDIKPYEESKNQTPGIDKRYSIHDFYFLKSLHGIKPGGMIAFITSRYTLDKQDTEVRSKIAEKADFVGAIRLPNNTFKEIANTEVVTDIIFLQKRSENKPISNLTKQFINTASLSLFSPDRLLTDISVNQYYIDHPEMILGIQDLTGSMYSGNEYTVNLPESDFSDRLKIAIDNLPKNMMSIIVDDKIKSLETEQHKPLSYTDSNSIPAGSFVIGFDTKLYQKDIKSNQIKLSQLYENETQNKDEINRIIKMSAIRDFVKNSFYHYYNGQQMEVNRDLSQLNALYDDFIKEHGFLNSRKNLFSFNADPDSALLQSLENWDVKNKTATKSEIFDGISFVKKEPITSVDSPLDAMVLSLSRYGHLNLPYMESLTGTEGEKLIDTLITAGHVYQDPYDFINNSRTTYVVADEYLSGNVREKLRYATLAYDKQPTTFNKNVSDLQNSIPRDIEAHDIALRMNSPIVGKQHVASFVKELLDTNKVNIVHVPITGKWEIDCRPNYVLDTETYGIHRLPAITIIDNLLNGRPIKVYDKDKNDKPVLNQELTSAAELKAEQIQSSFTQWLWKDEARTNDIVTRYNEVFNSHVERIFIHPERMTNPDAEIRFHGCNFPHAMRSHQADAVWRVLQQKNTMLAHTVGAGKTLEIACSAIELRRLGLRTKPMIVCPDHMIGQWAAEFRNAYPASKLLIADDTNWDQINRRTFVNKIGLGDWDAIIIRAESFKMIPMSSEYQKEFFEKKIEEYREILDTVDAKDKRKRSVKDLEKAITKYEDKISELSDMSKDEGVLPFDKLGVDHLFIDEADLYKNLEYYTQLQNVRGLGTAKGSERALDMLMKIRFVQENDGGITFATGTPISNTLVEAYTMQRFLQPETLKANGLEAFDEWGRQFAEAVTQMELNNTGTGYTPVTRFSKIVNVPELVSSLRQSWDIQTAQNLEKNGILVPGVNLPYMKIINSAAPSTPILHSYLKHLEKRESTLKGKPEKGSDNVLSIMTDGRKASVDMRLINPHLPDDSDSKLNMGVRIIYDVYTRYNTEKYSCAVFFDKARSFDSNDPSKVTFDGIKEMKNKLIQLGVKPSEIGDVRNCKSFDERRALFEKVNEGVVRVIFGSTGNMGAGTNYQKNLKAIVHLDVPWRPRDIGQQNGRGYRPGNQTGELEIYNCVTKGSLDTGLWNVLETKDNSIRQIMDGSDKLTRQIEESYYGSVKDLSIDNPIMKESVELDHSLRKLKSQARSFNDDIAHAHRRLQSLPGEIEAIKEYNNKVNLDITTRKPELKGDDFKILLDGKEFNERKDAGAYIKAVSQTLFLQAENSHRNIDKKIGSYAGYNLVLSSTIRDPYTISIISAHAPNFQYSAHIRQDSDPVSICRSLHNQIYKGPEKLLEKSQANLTEKETSIVNFTNIAKSVFPKQKELDAKVIRYDVVMALLTKSSENKAPEEVNTNDIQWSKIDNMLPDEIQQSVNTFLHSVNISPFLSQEKINPISSISDIQKSIQEKYVLSLPPTIISYIESNVSNGKLDLQSSYALVCATIEQNKCAGYAWKDKGNNPISFSSYVKDINRPNPDDINIQQVEDKTGSKYSAFKLLANNTSILLGTENNFPALKERVERYVICNAIKDKLSETISINNSKPEQHTNNPKSTVIAKQSSYDLEI